MAAVSHQVETGGILSGVDLSRESGEAGARLVAPKGWLVPAFAQADDTLKLHALLRRFSSEVQDDPYKAHEQIGHPCSQQWRP